MIQQEISLAEELAGVKWQSTAERFSDIAEEEGLLKNFMPATTLSHTAEETRGLGAAFGRALRPGEAVCFRGDLGAGKTTFIQGVLSVCGAERPYVSPTFVIMKEYDLATPTETGIRRIYHADAYRIEQADDFEKIGFSEWLSDPEGVVLLEWPERIESILPSRRIEVSLCLSEGESRRISIEPFRS